MGIGPRTLLRLSAIGGHSEWRSSAIEMIGGGVSPRISCRRVRVLQGLRVWVRV